MSRYDVIIGIDPDIDRDGVAILFPKNHDLSVSATPFGKTLAVVQDTYVQASASGFSFICVIEAGWLNHGNFHLAPKDTRPVVAAKGMAQGRNHQRGIDIAEYCKYNKIPFKLQKPLHKCWMGKDRKITEDELENIVGYPLRAKDKGGRSCKPNQECRDAALLAWVESGLPIHLTK